MSISLESIKTGAGKVFVPVKTISDAFIGNAEKMVSMQMDSRKVYSDIAFDQLKKMSSISSMEEAGDFFWGQIEPMGAVNKQLLADWKSFMSLNSELGSNLKSAFTATKEKPKKSAAKKSASSAPVASIIAEEPKPATKTKAKSSPRATKKTTSA